MKTTSAKYNARLLAYLLKRHGCKNIVVAPGSRNAPLILALSADEDYRTFSVPDERAAAFTALGMAMETRQPAAVICTSGSAAANFLPAVTEAFYQEVPLIAITADRPLEMIGQGLGQTINQQHIFGHHILAEANLLREPGDELARKYNQRLVNQSLIKAEQGPVHINVPFNEPLYDKTSVEEEHFQHFQVAPVENRVPETLLNELVQEWDHSGKIWVLVGQMPPAPELKTCLNKLNSQSPFLVLSETLSNFSGDYNVACIDRLLDPLQEAEEQDFAPELLITIGGEVVSKKIKKFLQQNPPKHHWHLHQGAKAKDTYGSLSRILPLRPHHFFEQLSSRVKPKSTSWRNHWHQKHVQRSKAHQQYIKEAPFSDLSAFKQIVQALPENSVLHCANSASIRYSQLFDFDKNILHFANRGTSGIDGSTSTAIGHAITTDRLVTLVTGDVAFMYDNAAFWNDRLPENLRVIVLNNSGGNIFRIIKGPAQIEQFERFQETHHQLNLNAIADMYELEYRQAQNAAGLEERLVWLYAERGLKILEVHTPRIESPEVLTNYFASLKTKQ